MSSVAEVLAQAALPRREAELLLEHVLDCNRAWLFAHGDAEVEEAQQVRVERLFTDRRAGVPVAYLLGRREFWSLPLAVTPAVLIPRPDTEVLVAWAIDCLAALPAPSALDLGTGSGAIALALKSECPALAMTAVDCSDEALAVARGNGEQLGLAVEWRKSDWFAGLARDDRWPLIVANPPYIPEHDPHLTAGDLPHEPANALVSGPDGLDALRHIIAVAPDHLIDSGWLLLEHGYDQAASVRQLLQARGFSDIASRTDLGGHERVTGGCWHVG